MKKYIILKKINYEYIQKMIYLICIANIKITLAISEFYKL